MDEPRSAQRYLEDLTPGGSEYFDNPKRCYEWAVGRIEAAHRIAMDAARDRNRQRERADVLLAENERLAGRLRIATETLTEIAHCGCSACGPAPRDLAHARTMADDALTQMSVVE